DHPGPEPHPVRGLTEVRGGEGHESDRTETEEHGDPVEPVDVLQGVAIDEGDRRLLAAGPGRARGRRSGADDVRADEQNTRGHDGAEPGNSEELAPFLGVHAYALLAEVREGCERRQHG